VEARLLGRLRQAGIPVDIVPWRRPPSSC